MSIVIDERTAFVFPGQGSQSIGMLAELAQQYPIVQQTFTEVSDELHDDIWTLTQDGPLERLNQTAYTQVAMLTADVAVFRVIQQQVDRIHSTLFAGHSLGEYAALVAAEALSLKDAAKLVQTRGQLMQETIPLGSGAMAAIVGLSDEIVAEICTMVTTPESVVSPANYNAVGQVVIAGHTAAVEKALLEAERREARLAKIIPVSVPCHCGLLKPAAAKFFEILQTVQFHQPKYAVLSTVDLQLYDSTIRMRTILAEQLYRPVRWVEVILAMQASGVHCVIECGPGKVLSGLIKRIDKSIHALSVYDPSSLTLALDTLTA